MKIGPRYRKEREYESRIHEFRVKRSFTILQLTEKLGCSQGTVSGLGNGTIPPFYISRSGCYGKIRPVVLKLSKILNTSLEVLFPRYFCAIDIQSKTAGLLDCQLLDITLSLSITDPELLLDRKQSYSIIYDVIKKLPFRLELLFYLRFQYGYTLDELGRVFGITRERSRQLERDILRKLRYHLRVNKKTILDFL